MENYQKINATLNDEYEQGEQIGEGTFGVVYKGRRMEDGHEIALKLSIENCKERQAKYEIEYEMLKDCVHKHVLRALDHGRLNTRHPVIVTELMVGTVEEYRISADFDATNSEGKLKAALSFAYQAAQGLEHIHELNYVHHDVKPSNLLLTIMNGKGIVKLSDFGLAKKLGAGQTCKCKAGDPQYFAPEQAEAALGVEGASGDHDQAVDVHALGQVLLYLIGGLLAFTVNRMPWWKPTLNDAEPLERLLLQIADAENVIRWKIKKGNEDALRATFLLVPHFVRNLLKASLGVAKKERVTIRQFLEHKSFTEYSIGKAAAQVSLGTDQNGAEEDDNHIHASQPSGSAMANAPGQGNDIALALQQLARMEKVQQQMANHVLNIDYRLEDAADENQRAVAEQPHAVAQEPHKESRAVAVAPKKKESKARKYITIKHQLRKRPGMHKAKEDFKF